MTTKQEDDKPMLASLVQAGDQQTEAIALNDFIFMAKDISNAYLVNTKDGDVMINTGFVSSAERNKAVFEPVRSGALKAIILTQAHPQGRAGQLQHVVAMGESPGDGLHRVLGIQGLLIRDKVALQHSTVYHSGVLEGLEPASLNPAVYGVAAPHRIVDGGLGGQQSPPV